MVEVDVVVKGGRVCGLVDGWTGRVSILVWSGSQGEVEWGELRDRGQL